MRVFVTGATGWVGSALVRDLIAGGHEVTGLARSDEAAAALETAGARAHRGRLEEPDSLAAGARDADGVVHLAFIHDFSTFEQNAQVDRRAVEAMLAAIAGTGKPFVGTSGTAIASGSGMATEDSTPAPMFAGGRGGTEAVITRADGVRGSVVRLAPTVHGRGDHGFVPLIIDLARQTGTAAYLGDGANRWPAVHRDDAARLFQLALEKGAAGSILHGVAEEGIAMRDIAGAIGEGIGVPVVSVGPDEAPRHFGLIAPFAAIDNPSSSERTRAALGWMPTGPGLIEDLRANYFG